MSLCEGMVHHSSRFTIVFSEVAEIVWLVASAWLLPILLMALFPFEMCLVSFLVTLYRAHALTEILELLCLYFA